MSALQGAVTLFNIASTVIPIPGLPVAAQIAEQIVKIIDVRMILLIRSFDGPD